MTGAEVRACLAHLEGLAEALVTRAQIRAVGAALVARGAAGDHNAGALGADMSAAGPEPAALGMRAAAICERLRAAPGAAALVAERVGALDRWVGLLFDPAIAADTGAATHVRARVVEACDAVRAVIAGGPGAA